MTSESKGAAAPERPALRLLGRVVSALAALATALGAACLLVSLALIGWAVVMRYVFNDAPIWVDEVVGFALVAVVMLSAASALRSGEHINVDLLLGFLSTRARRWAQAWAALATLLVAVLLVVNGSETATLAHRLGLLTEGSLEWPTWLLMLFMPIGGTLLGLAAIEALWRAIVGEPPTGTPSQIGKAPE